MRTLAALFFAVFIVIASQNVASASIFTSLSDFSPNSAPSVESTHTITFTIFKPVPASGKILVTPASGRFSIPAGFDFGDIDLAVATDTNFNYVERPLAASVSGVDDGVLTTTGLSGGIVFTLNSTTGIAAGEHVRMKIGTNASFGGAGDDSWTNPDSVGSHRIFLETRNGGNTLLDALSVIDAIVAPVEVRGAPIILVPVLSNGLPQGTIAAGNDQIEISIETDIISTCRYSMTPGVTYASMTNTFTFTRDTIHTMVHTGFADNTGYTYYVRCSALGSSLATDSDYIISFTLEPTPSSEVSETVGQVIPGVSGYLGSGGSGDFPNGSSVLYSARVDLSGFAIPGSVVTILKDGKSAATTQAKTDGTFSSTIAGLERGTYSFQLYDTDSRGVSSSGYGTTLTVGQGTINTITNIIIPPTISLLSPVSGGGAADIIGETLANALVEMTLSRQSDATTLSAPLIYTASTTGAGKWAITVPGDQFSNGTYIVKARTFKTEDTESGYSKTLLVGVGENTSACGASTDINADTKVNLTDFSIFLTLWGTSSGRADFNCDQKVNLADFSIMLFNWTG